MPADHCSINRVLCEFRSKPREHKKIRVVGVSLYKLVVDLRIFVCGEKKYIVIAIVKFLCTTLYCKCVSNCRLKILVFLSSICFHNQGSPVNH